MWRLIKEPRKRLWKMRLNQPKLQIQSSKFRQWVPSCPTLLHIILMQQLVEGASTANARGPRSQLLWRWMGEGREAEPGSALLSVWYDCSEW